MDVSRLGTAEIERLICDPQSLGSLETLMPRVADAWSIRFPDLSALAAGNEPDRPIKICIATEDIVGPVRNGGIGTTYAALAEMLGGLSFDVTILYLQGQEVENGTIDEWVQHYAKRGVKFVPVPNYAAADRFQTGADRWLRAPYNMLRYLLDHPMDVVHVSEWRGSAYLSLLAKRQGLAFADTLFVVKTSSPWLWNRIYGSHPVERLEDLAKIQAERCSVEYADMIIGGSLHLLQWMASQGYQIPRQKTFVQPNVVSFEHLRPLMAKRSFEKGSRIKVDEFVFFGRLEGRKGLLVFCQAIKRMIRANETLPPKITFMGKPGARLTSRPDQDITDFIQSETADWPCKVQTLSDFQQYEALEYLLSGDRLAVMPSIIENSSLAVYETAICGIPFVASNSGGTPELVHPDDHAEVLCDAHPVPLSAKLQKTLQDGAYVARASFDNDVNLETWKRFHLNLRRGLDKRLQNKITATEAPNRQRVVLCIYFPGRLEPLRESLKSIAAQDHKDYSVVIAVDGPRASLLEDAKQIAVSEGVEAKIIECFDLDAGLAFNRAADAAAGDYLLFMWAGVTLRPNALWALVRVAQSSGADLVNFFYRLSFVEAGDTRDYLKAYIIGSVTESFFRVDVEPVPFMVKARSFETVGGFSSDYRVVGQDHEFIAKALIVGLKCDTVLLELGTVPAWDTDWLYRECYDQSTTLFRAIRPHIASVPLALRELLLMSKGLQIKPRPKAKAPNKPKAADTITARARPVAPKTYFNKMMLAFLSEEEQATSGLKAGANAPRTGASTSEPRRSRQERAIERAPASSTNGAEPPKRRPADQRQMTGAAIRGIAGGRDLIGIYRGKLYGYVRDPLDDKASIEVCLKDGNRIIARQQASAVLPTATGRNSPPYGFIFNLRSITRLHKRVRPWHLSVVEAGSEAKLGTVIAPGLIKRLAAYGLEGYCDLGEGPIVRGWVWAPDNPHQNFDVSIFIDQKFFAKVSASAKREDLEANNIGHGNFGFNVSIPRPLRDGTPHEIDVVVSQIGINLKRGRLSLMGDKLSFR